MPTAEPLLVYGPRSLTYDFGPDHPLTPRRFGPGIDLLRTLGAEPSVAPQPVGDEALIACHTEAYVATVRAFSADPFREPEAGIGTADDPAFPGMHEAAASVAGGTLAAAGAILEGSATHAFHPGGGLHHAMRDHASGFCIYNDPALAIARFRATGLRVLYVDLDTHHGDGVQAIHLDDPGVLTFSIHESGRYLFPWTGFLDEFGHGAAAGTAVNVPLEPYTGESAWLEAVRTIVPALAASFGPDVIVSQHGADSHAWDPLAHLRVTTTAMGEAARIVDAVAHRYAGGRWLATGGGGYDAYRVVPRSWSLVWLAMTHRDPPAELPLAWRARWTPEAERFGQAPLPVAFTDEPNAGRPVDAGQADAEERSQVTIALARRLFVPRLVDEAVRRGWLDPMGHATGAGGPTTQRAGREWPSTTGVPAPVVRTDLAVDAFDGLVIAPGVLPLAATAEGPDVLAGAVRSGSSASVALSGDVVVGVALVGPGHDASTSDVLWVGVAPAFRRARLGRSLLAAAVERTGGRTVTASVTVGDRDAIEAMRHRQRATIARALLTGAGFRVSPMRGAIGRADPEALEAIRPA